MKIMANLRNSINPSALAPLANFYTPWRVQVLALFLSALTGGLAIALGYSMAVIAFGALIPWVPVLLWKFQGDWKVLGWMAVFEFLVAFQLAHFAEHAAQVIELHVWEWQPARALGIISELDAEGVHWWWNTAVFFLVVLLLLRYRDNKWLWASFFFALWHELEHAYIYFYWVLGNGVHEHPGILGQGGLVDGWNIDLGLLTNLGRADLHFGYNLFEVGFLLIAFLVQVNALFGPRVLVSSSQPVRRFPLVRGAWMAAALAQYLLIIGIAFVTHAPASLRVPENYPTLQAAINAAPAWAIIRIAPGTYEGPLDIRKPLSIIGAPNGETRLSAGDDVPVVQVARTHDVTLKGLTISGGMYGILVDESTDVQITNNHVINPWFVGIRLSRASAKIVGNQVRGARSPFGMGIELANTMSRPPSLIRQNVIVANPHEGFVMHNSEAMIDKNVVTGNGLRGIAVTEMSMATVRGNTISDNADAGIFVVDSSMAEIIGNQIRRVRRGPNGNADGVRAYYYAEVMLSNNIIELAPEHAVVSGYEALIGNGVHIH